MESALVDTIQCKGKFSNIILIDNKGQLYNSKHGMLESMAYIEPSSCSRNYNTNATQFENIPT